MMKNKTKRMIVNGVVLGALAAVGAAAYQLGTSPVKEQEITEEVQIKSELPKEETEQEEEIFESVQEEETTDSVDMESEDVENSFTEAAAVPEDVDNLEESDTDFQEGDETSQADTQESVQIQETAAAAVSLPELDFSEDTLMQWPVNGNILLDYSMDQTTYYATLDQYRLSPAIAVQAVEGAPVTAAAAGRIFSIENNAQTGTTVTMELGNGYQAVYGQLKDLTVEEGEVIKEGTILGYISAPTKYYSTEGSNLYFAMKKDGEPIDPIMYLP